MNMQISNYGWQCPKCNRIYSPATPECYYCNKVNTTVTSGYLEIKKEREKSENNENN